MTLVLAIGLILLLVGLVMVLSSAFKHGFSWGLAILLLPVVAPVYVVFKWSEHQARNGLFIAIVGLSVVAAAFYGGVGREITTLSNEVPSKGVQQQVKKLVEKIPTAGPPDKPLPNQVEVNKIKSEKGKDYDPIHGDDEYAYTQIDALPPDEDVRVAIPEQPKVTYEYQVITTDQVDKFYSKQLKVATKRGELREGKLVRSDERSLFLESVVDSGIVEFQYEFKDIAALLVYEVSGVVAAMNAPASEASTPELNASANQATSELTAAANQDKPEFTAAANRDKLGPSTSTHKDTPVSGATTSESVPKLGASTSDDTPEPSASMHHDPTGANNTKSISPARPMQRSSEAASDSVADPAPAKSTVQVVVPSSQAKQAASQTRSVTTTSVTVAPKNVAPIGNSGAKPVIYIKPKSSPNVESVKSAEQPEPTGSQTSDTSMAMPIPPTSMETPVVQ